MPIIEIEGQQIEVGDEIAGNDEAIRALLKPTWPDAANATLTRTTKEGVLTIKVTKKAGTKGAIVADLLAAPERINPALAMQERLAGLQSSREISHLQMLKLKPQIEVAIKDGRAEIKAVQRALEVLLDAPPVAGNRVPRGF
ncbi:MAG TPA: hypothetical protein VJ302_23300 [Blastocatellia bacterium]|nr:hypothetical protein [Blastocatellia bacterium]